MNMGDYTWLHTICSTTPSRVVEIGHPWTIQRNGEAWTVATNGSLLVMTRGDHGFPPADTGAPNFEAVLAPALVPLPRRLNVVELRHLAMPWRQETGPACAVCQNTGGVTCETCDGAGVTECECSCGDEHDTECYACAGDGSVDCEACPYGAKGGRTRRPVWIGDALFDLRLFAKVFPHVDGDEAAFRQAAPHLVAVLELGDWIVLVMPLNREAMGERANTAPRLTFAEAVVA